jgi:hypothetical protein
MSPHPELEFILPGASNVVSNDVSHDRLHNWDSSVPDYPTRPSAKKGGDLCAWILRESRRGTNHILDAHSVSLFGDLVRGVTIFFLSS